jgi:hypothetical protein
VTNLKREVLTVKHRLQLALYGKAPGKVSANRKGRPGVGEARLQPRYISIVFRSL